MASRVIPDADACVVPAPDDRLGSVPVAAVVPHERTNGSALGRQLIQWVKDRLAPLEVPSKAMLGNSPFAQLLKTHRLAVVRRFED